MNTKRTFAPAILCIASLASLIACAPGVSEASGSSAALPTSATSSSGVPSNSTQPTAATYEEQALAWGRQFADCARSHGIATFPDPTYPEGISRDGADESFTLVVFGDIDKGMLGQALGVCHDLALQMPPPPEALQPPQPATLEHMRQWAQCLREHGLSDFPDPRSDGRFPVLGTQYEEVNARNGFSPAVAAALDVCRQYQDEWGFKAS